MCNLDALPIFLVGRDPLGSKDSLKAVHVLAVAHLALWTTSGSLGDIGPLRQVCAFISQELKKAKTSYLPAADSRCERKPVEG